MNLYEILLHLEGYDKDEQAMMLASMDVKVHLWPDIFQCYDYTGKLIKESIK